MSRRGWLLAVGLLVVAVAGYLAYDAAVVTDEERLEAFSDDVTGVVSLDRLHNAKATWVDLAREPVEIRALGRTVSFVEGEDDALEAHAVDSLRPLMGARFTAMSRSVSIDGAHATVTLRLVSRERGMFNAEWSLDKQGDDWLVSRLAVQR